MLEEAVVGERRRILTRSIIRHLAQAVGRILVAVSVLTLAGMVLTPFDAAALTVRGIALLVDMLLVTTGLVLMIEGKRVQTRWTCSLCDGDLHRSDEIVCPSCGAGLRW